MADEEKSLRETMAEVAKKIDELKEQKKVKTWSLPFTAKLGMGKKKKRQGYIVFMNIGLNKAVTFIKAPVVDNVALVNNVPHVIHPEDILIWKNRIPMVVQAQWDERPYNVRYEFDEAVKNNRTTMGWEYIMNFILKTQIQAKKNISWGFIVIGVLAVIGLGYYLIKSGALKG